MAHSPEHNPVSPEALRLGYEPQRISIKGLLIFIVLAALFMVVLEALLAWMMHGIERHDDRADLPRSVLTVDQQPPAPNLQPSIGHDALDYQDLEQDRQEEDRIFSRLGWEVNPVTHQVTIPGKIVQEVAEKQAERAKAAYVPPTTTGKDSNSTVPGAVPPFDTRPGSSGGQRP